VEKDGTFVNCHGRIQRIGQAFPPRQGSREDWRFLLELAGKLGQTKDWRTCENIFNALAKASAPFQGLSYKTIGSQGVEVATANPGPAAV
jgi:predicted molibdopterin-dependent oxidoreductase YjgC